jgi:PAS domain S-box-containing protein
LVENFNEGALNLSEDGLIVYTNSYFYELLRLPYEKVISNAVFDFIHPSSKEIFRKLLKKGLAGQAKGEINLLAGGEIIPVYVSLTSLQPMLQTVGMIVTDLREKKKQERSLEQKNKELEQKNAELKKQKELLETIINNTPDLIGVYDHEMRILEFNKACENLFQIKREEVLGKFFYEVFPTTKTGQAYKDLQRVLAGETIANLDYHSPLTGRHYQNFLCPLKDEGGKIYGAIAIAHDITDVIEFSEKIKQSEEKFNKLFSSSPLGLTLSEVPSGKLVDVNKVQLETIGYTREEYLGRTSLELKLVDKDDRQKILDELYKNGCIKNVEVNIRSKSGKIIPVLNSIETITIGDKKYFLSAIIDITERKKAEEQIAQANHELKKMNEELQSFTYISSHDLQEPLRKIQTFATRILEKEHENLSEAGKNYFWRMQNAANRMQLLIDDLLAYSRTNTGEHKFETVELNKIIEQVKQDLKEELREKQAVVQTTGKCKISVIPFQFHQLIYNLISNSLKFSNPGIPPHIAIKSEMLPDSHSPLGEKVACHIAIADNGIGFDAEYGEKIFELFYRLHGKNEYNGTGIGLAIVKKIVDNHGGIITANGEPNKGAAFDIYLPAT